MLVSVYLQSIALCRRKNWQKLNGKLLPEIFQRGPRRRASNFDLLPAKKITHFRVLATSALLVLDCRFHSHVYLPYLVHSSIRIETHQDSKSRINLLECFTFSMAFRIGSDITSSRYYTHFSTLMRKLDPPGSFSNRFRIPLRSREWKAVIARTTGGLRMFDIESPLHPKKSPTTSLKRPGAIPSILCGGENTNSCKSKWTTST